MDLFRVSFRSCMWAFIFAQSKDRIFLRKRKGKINRHWMKERKKKSTSGNIRTEIKAIRLPTEIQYFILSKFICVCVCVSKSSVNPKWTLEWPKRQPFLELWPLNVSICFCSFSYYLVCLSSSHWHFQSQEKYILSLFTFGGRIFFQRGKSLQ